MSAPRPAARAHRCAAALPAAEFGHLPGKLVALGRGHGTGPWKIRWGLASPGFDRENGTRTGAPARTETTTLSDRGTEPGIGAGKGMGTTRGGTGTGEGIETGTGERIGTEGGTETPTRTDTGTQAVAQVSKEVGKSLAKAGRGTQPRDRPGTQLGDRPGRQPHPLGPGLGKPRSLPPRGRRTSVAMHHKGEGTAGDTGPCDHGQGQSALPWLPRKPI